MKMVVAIVHPEDAGALVDALTDKDFRVTRLHSQGGFLKQSHATILAGVEEAQVDDVIATIRETCRARLCARVRQMARDGVLAEAETLRDVAVCATRGGELHDFDLALAQASSPATLRYKTGAAS